MGSPLKLKPAFIHVFEHCCDPNAYALNPPAPAPDGRVVSSVAGTSLDASTPGGIAQRARGSSSVLVELYLRALPPQQTPKFELYLAIC